MILIIFKVIVLNIQIQSHDLIMLLIEVELHTKCDSFPTFVFALSLNVSFIEVMD